MSLDRDRLARIIFSGINDIEEWRLGDPALAAAKGYPRDYPADLVDDYGIVFVDLTLDASSGAWVCHEVNGPNAVGSDALTGDSLLRAENEARQAVRRAREFGYVSQDGRFTTQVATVHAHQHWRFFRTGGEFYPRVARFADSLEAQVPGNEICCHAAGDPLGDEQIAVMVGDVPSIARNIRVDSQSGRFSYCGRPLIFMGNPNLLPELIRIGALSHEGRNAETAAQRILHGWRLTAAVHDKGLQQTLFEGTGIRPLRHFSADTVEDALHLTRQALTDGPVVLKPSETSGGTGVTAIVDTMSDADIRACLDTMIADCRAKYGDNCEATIFPIRGFEFVRSTGFPMDGGEHLWDLRIAVQFEPGRAQAYPVSFRFTPQPFDPDRFHLDRGQWVSNVSGRRETLLKSGMDDAVLERVGITDNLIDAAMQACVRWTLKAWDLSVRGGSKPGSLYEDSREEVDKPFYQWEKFTA